MIEAAGGGVKKKKKYTIQVLGVTSHGVSY